jgi:hypothetical protein
MSKQSFRFSGVTTTIDAVAMCCAKCGARTHLNFISHSNKSQLVCSSCHATVATLTVTVERRSDDAY